MRHLFLVLAATLSLAGCATLGLPSAPGSPAVVADTTKLDEQAALAVELAYQASGRTIIFADKAGLLANPALRARVAAADRAAKRAVDAVRRAYDSGNAASYPQALIEARAAIASLTGLFPKD